MRKILLFVALMALIGMLFSGCKVRSNDYEAGVGTAQGYKMYQYWNIGLRTIEMEYLDVAYELNRYLFVDDVEEDDFYEVSGGENGVYQLYQDGSLIYEINTGGKMLTDEEAHWTIELKSPNLFSYCGGDYHALSPFPDGTIAHLRYQQDNTWNLQMGELQEDLDGTLHSAYLEMNVKLLDVSATCFSKSPLELSGQGLLYYEKWSDDELWNSISFNIDETLVMDGRYVYESGKLQLNTGCGTRNETDKEQHYDIYEVQESSKQALITFFKEHNEHLMRIEVNDIRADWYQNGTFYRNLE